MAYTRNADRDAATLEHLREQRRKYQKNFRDKNPTHARDRARVYRERHPERVVVSNRKNFLNTTYGLTPEKFEELVIAQDSKCAICHRLFTGTGRNGLFVDHNHTTNAIRGLLCRNCNVMIGMAGESGQTLTSAIEYLRHHQEPSCEASNEPSGSSTG